MRRVLWVILALLAPFAAAAQPASLVADRLRIEADRTLIAEGNVEVFYDDVRLTASRIAFDSETEALEIEGPVSITEADGRIVLLGEDAALEPGLRDGILTGARMVLDQQMQIAAAELASIDGRYRRLTRAVASSCRVCATGDTPLWEIRAERALHDTETRQIYFSNAQFRVAGIPVLYIPRLRMPDPTVERARGFLVPELRQSSDLGRGVRAPYFIPLGRSVDVTVAPYIATNTTTVELRYRQEFRRGSVIFEGAFSRDDLRPDETRSYVFGQGNFDLPAGFDLDFDIRATSDDEYLDVYDYYSGARLESQVTVNRVRDDELIEGSVSRYDILRPGSLREGDRALVDLGLAEYERVFATPLGRLRFGADVAALGRDSSEDVVGRDVTRLGAEVGWFAGQVLPQGVVLEAEAQIRADRYDIRRDSTFPDDVSRVIPAAAVALRWPLRRASGGVFETLEPVVQLAWSDYSGDAPPNEDSRVVDFDEGNLFALDRNPGVDRVETGARLNFGLAYTRVDPSGWAFNGVLGRVLRLEDEDQFTDASGLSGDWSDWLVSGQVALGDRLTITNRALFGDDMDVSRNELRLAFDAGRGAFATSYLWLQADPVENRLSDVHEASFEADYRLSRHWLAGVGGRWDFEADRASRAGLDLTYRNECVAVDLSLSRRYLSAGSVDPTYDFGIEVSLVGFGSSDSSGYARSCPG